MRFLVTNDDGFHAQGIQLLAKIAAEFGEVHIVAPLAEQSGISHRITFEQPMNLNEVGEKQFTVNGTPADCVRVAFSVWENQFDVVLSGVNNGANLGVDVFYSGTVAAAREATFFQIPAIAFSQHRANYQASFDFEKTVPLARRLLKQQLDKLADCDYASLTNINLPDRAQSAPSEEIEVVLCEVDPSPLPADFRKDNGSLIYGGKYADRPRNKGQDTDVCFSGNVSLSEIRGLVPYRTGT